MNKRLAILIVFICGMALLNNAYAFDLDSSDKIDIHGFITQGYLVTDDNNFLADTEGDGTLQYNEIGINFSSDVSDRLRMGVQLLTRDLGKMGNHEITLDWAVADYSFFNWMNLRVGKIKTPHGLYNIERDVDMLRTFVFLPQSVYTEGWRDSLNASNGAGLYGYIPAGLLGNITYMANLTNSEQKVGGGESRLLEDQLPQSLDVKVKEMNTKQTFSTSLTLDTLFNIDGLKISGVYWGHDFDSTCDVNDGLGSPLFDANSVYVDGEVAKHQIESVFKTKVRTVTGSMEYSYGNFIFAAEYMQNNYRLKMPLSDYVYYPGTSVTVPDVDKDFDAMGYYGSMAYRFTDWFEMGAYYAEYYRDKDDKNGKKAVAEGLVSAGQEHNRWLKDSCLSFRFDITPNWILKLESHYMDGSALMFHGDGNTIIDSDGNVQLNYEPYWMLYAAKVSFSF